MRKKALVGTLAGVLMVASLKVSGQQAKHPTKDEIENKANSDLENHKFINEARVKISANQKKIDALKAKKMSLRKVVNDRYKKRVAVLEARNEELRKKIEASITHQPNKWTMFKQTFNHDMSELAHAIQDIGHDGAR